MANHRFVLSCTLLFALCRSSMAQDIEEYAEPQLKEACQENSLTLMECFGDQEQHSKTYLSQLIAEVERELSEPRQQELFRQVQTAWAALRASSCNLDASMGGGNSALAIRVRCQHIFNKDRIIFLQQYRKCIRGGCDGEVSIGNVLERQRYIESGDGK